MKKTIFVIFAYSIHLSFAEIIPLDREEVSGCPYLVVDVRDAENNPQRVLIDTGSDHSYLYKHSMMRALPRAGESPGGRIAGFRGSQIPQNQLSVAEARQINYVGYSGVHLEQWTRKRFTSGTHSWIQKFAVAVLPQSQLARWDPNESGLIGAGPSSKFTQVHPHFGLIPRRNGEVLELFVNEPINPAWCRDGRIVYAPIIDEDIWYFESSRISIDGFAITVERFNVAADTGGSATLFPQVVFDGFRQQLERLSIPSLRFDNDIQRLRFEYQYLLRIPDLTVTLVSGASFTISKHEFCTCVDTTDNSPCMLKVFPLSRRPDEIILGIQLFNNLVVEFDSSNADQKQIGFCEPIDAFDATSPPRITMPQSPPPDAPPPLRRPGNPPPDAPPRRRPTTLVPGNVPPGALPLRIPNDVVEDNDEADTNGDKPTESDQKATRELQTYAIPIAMLVIASTLIA
jgi:hypothetical protein